MAKILLSSKALATKRITDTFLELVEPLNKEIDPIVIITNAVFETKKHPKSVELKKSFKQIGFFNVKLFDVLTDDLSQLKEAKAIIVMGGYVFPLLDSLKKSKADEVIKKFFDNDGLVYGISAGAMVLGNDVDFYNTLYPEDNPEKLSSKAIGLIDFNIFPHIEVQLVENPDLLSKINEYEHKYTHIKTIKNDQAIVVVDSEMHII